MEKGGFKMVILLSGKDIGRAMRGRSPSAAEGIFELKKNARGTVRA